MKVTAVCDQGVVRLPEAIGRRLRHVEVVVEIPDEALTNPSGEGEDQRHSHVGKALDAILGPYRCGNGEVEPRIERNAWHEHLEEKYLK